MSVERDRINAIKRAISEIYAIPFDATRSIAGVTAAIEQAKNAIDPLDKYQEFSTQALLAYGNASAQLEAMLTECERNENERLLQLVEREMLAKQRVEQAAEQARLDAVREEQRIERNAADLERRRALRRQETEQTAIKEALHKERAELAEQRELAARLVSEARQNLESTPGFEADDQQTIDGAIAPMADPFEALPDEPVGTAKTLTGVQAIAQWGRAEIQTAIDAAPALSDAQEILLIDGLLDYLQSALALSIGETPRYFLSSRNKANKSGEN